MTLFQVLLNLQQFSDEMHIYVQRPWTLDSDANVCSQTAFTATIPEPPDSYTYFLDAALCKALLAQSQTRNLCLQDSCMAMIEYALQNKTEINT